MGHRGRPPAGGSGDPSPVTAIGVVHAMGAVLEELDGEATLRGRRVVVQGAGHVGASARAAPRGRGCARRCRRPLPRARAAPSSSAHGVEALPVDACARRAVRRPRALRAGWRGERRDWCPPAVPRDLRGREQPARRPRRRRRRSRRGGSSTPPTSSPTPAASSTSRRSSPVTTGQRALAATARIGDTTRRVFEHAVAEGVAPARAAEALAPRRIAEEGGGRRWRPGDAAAWTNGEPLRTLRP